MTEPSVADPRLFRELLAEMVRNGELTPEEAVRCWRIHGLPMERWLRRTARLRAK